MRERIEAILATGATAGVTLSNLETALKITAMALCAGYWFFKLALIVRDAIKAWKEDHRK